MTLFLLAACIENSFNDGPKDRVASDTAVDTDAADTDTTVDTGETGTPTDTDPADTAPADTDLPDDTAVDTDTPVDTGTSVDTGEEPDTEPPGPVAVTGVCGASTYTSWAEAAAVEPELHVVGMYESQLGSPGMAYVTVTRTAEMVLMLTSYEPVDWQVDLAPGTQVTEIVVSYYDPASTVTFVSATTAPVTDARWIGECGYQIPDTDPTSGCETPDLRTVTEAYTGLVWSSFQGCYAGGEFVVEG